MAPVDDLVEVGPWSHEFALPRGYRAPSSADWDLIRQRDLWRPDRAAPEGWRPTPSVILWERPTDEVVPPLGNYGVTASPPSLMAVRADREKAESLSRYKKRQANRRLRYSMRNAAQDLSDVRSVCSCGRIRAKIFGSEITAINVVVGASGAHYTGLARCGSVWNCPVCMYRICRERAEEVRTLVQRHRDTGGGVYMLTLTMPHDALDALGPMRRHVSAAWRKATSGEVYRRLKNKLKIVGTVRAMEVTNGPSGWHPHLHILILTAERLENKSSGLLGSDAITYKTVVARRWARYITSRNSETGKAYRAPSREHGVSFVASHRDEYIAKLGLADELTRGSWKRSKELAGYRTPLQVLRDIAGAKLEKRAPVKRDVALWREYAAEMRGARQLTWSRGLRVKYDMGPEQTDLQLAEREEADAGAIVYSIDAAVWDRWLRNNWSARAEILSGAELRGWEGVQAVFDRLKGLEPVPF